MNVAIYDRVGSILNEASRSEVGFLELVACAPYRLPAERPIGLRQVLHDYHRILVETWLSGAWPESLCAPVWAAPVQRSVFSDVDPECLLPSFFRTDESPSGKIYEIQCPGGWWGITQALQLALGHAGPHLSTAFAEELDVLFPEGARILHLFDTAGLPHESLYFAHAVRKADRRIRYRGIDRNVMSVDCNFIRSHSYPSLVAEDLFRWRVRRLADGSARFDHPPLPIFDQKLPMCLPFYPETAAWFTDSHRQLFPYTAPIVGPEVRLESGEVVTVGDFIRLPGEDRRFFLKYAGTDTTRNYGSRAVHRLADLSVEQLEATFTQVADDVEHGEPWIIQREIRQQEDVEFLARDGGVRRATLTARVSAFYGPTRMLGILFLAAPEAAVHGAVDTVLSLVDDGT